ncbi:MAG: aldo/keto reductase [Deltaproteobacteria bacterium]|jgi:diketogulonate reductase-like aldo/keto reductase
MIPSFLYGTAWKEERTAALTTLALRAGFVGIDTANQRKHYFEAGVGEGIAAAIEAGVVTREQLFLQTKFTYQRGQDHRLPYDPAARPAEQVRQSFAKSLEQLRTTYLDSLVLHGPELRSGLTDTDREVWATMSALVDEGCVRHIGVSNVAPDQLALLFEAEGHAPRFVQNRCYARLGWDAEVRALCGEHDVIYQGFSLLTANTKALSHPDVRTIAQRHGATIPQVVFAFARAVGMLPLTGTSDPKHMAQDLEAMTLTLTPEEVEHMGDIAISPPSRHA